MFPKSEPAARFHEVFPPGPQPQLRPPLVVHRRVPDFVGAERPSRSAFHEATAAVIGLGSVGRRIALHLARLGIARLFLIDGGRFDDSANLVTQAILPHDLAQGKAAATARACRAISPRTRVFAYEGQAADLDPIQLSGVQHGFLATDNLVAEVHAAQSFMALGIPLTQASVHGETLVAQVRNVSNRCASGPCLVCGYGSAEWREVDRATVFRCGGPGSNVDAPANVMPTMSTSFLCSLAADLAMLHWTRQLLGLGRSTADTILQFSGCIDRTTTGPLVRNPSCRADHVVLRRLPAPRRLGECTLRELAEASGLGDGASGGGLSYVVANMAFVESAACKCGQSPLGRFIAIDAPAGKCRACGGDLIPVPFFTHRQPTPCALGTCHDQPLARVGAADAAWVVIRNDADGVFIAEFPPRYSP